MRKLSKRNKDQHFYVYVLAFVMQVNVFSINLRLQTCERISIPPIDQRVSFFGLPLETFTFAVQLKPKLKMWNIGTVEV